jgi:hypothetical protein
MMTDLLFAITIIGLRLVALAVFGLLLFRAVERLLRSSGGVGLGAFDRDETRRARLALIALWAALAFDALYRSSLWISAIARSDPPGTELPALVMAILMLTAALLSLRAFRPWQQP